MGQVARALLALDPLNEVGTMVLAEALALEGSKVEALRLLQEYEEEVGAVNTHLQLPVRVLRQRVAEVLDDSFTLRRFDVPFVGREREFGELRRLLREMCAGESRAAFITGEAGIGKSRLAGEVMRLAALDGATIASYTTSSGDAFTPISTLVSVGQQLLTLPGSLGCAQEHLSYVRRLGTSEAATAWSVMGMAADILYAQLVQAFAELVSAIAEEAPLVLFVDDAERLHPTTWRVLVDVWERVGARSVFFLLASRRLPTWFGSLGARSCERLAQQVRLFPFGRYESLKFLNLWSAKNHLPIELETAQRFAATSQGNPFYLSEIAAHLASGGDPQQTPTTIRELIASQHSALSKGAQRVLLVIALFEARATTGRVTQLLGVPAVEYMAGLDELEDAGLVATKGQGVWCRHRLVGELSMSLAMPGVLAFAHGRAAELLEAESDAVDSLELLGDCVSHWERAGETRRAYLAAMKLGYRLVGLGMGEEAKSAYESAQRFAETDEDLLLAIEGSVTASRLCADWQSVVVLCNERSAVRSRIGTVAGASDEFGLYLAEANMFTLAKSDWIADLLHIANAPSAAHAFRLRAATLAAMIGDNNYAPQCVIEAFSGVEELCAHSGTDADSLLCLLVYHTSVGNPRRVRDLAFDYAEIARRSTDKRQQIHGLRRAANALIRVGLHEVAHPLLHETLSVSQELKLPGQCFASSDVLMTSYLLQGQLSLAEAELVREREIVALKATEAMKIMLRYSSTMFAWITNDRQIARELVSEQAPRVQHLLAATQYCATIGEVALKLLVDPSTIGSEELRSCETLFDAGKGLGRQDLNTSILCSAFAATGDVARARRIERDYWACRRELTPGLFAYKSQTTHSP